MITRIRDVRRAKRMTLDDVARACDPPTTPQTIGRLETGTRTVSVAWLNRIARALDVPAHQLVDLDADDGGPMAVAATIDADGAHALKRRETADAPAPPTDAVAVRVAGSVGDYRAGDLLWCRRIGPDAFANALNRDVLVPRPAGRYLFGRMIGRDGDRMLILPPGAASRQQVVVAPPWAAVAATLIRALDWGKGAPGGR